MMPCHRTGLRCHTVSSSYHTVLLLGLPLFNIASFEVVRAAFMTPVKFFEKKTLKRTDQCTGSLKALAVTTFEFVKERATFRKY